MRGLEDEIYAISDNIIYDKTKSNLEFIIPPSVNVLKIINNSLYLIFRDTRKMILTEFEK
jgi:hypothetical protein